MTRFHPAIVVDVGADGGPAVAAEAERVLIDGVVPAEGVGVGGAGGGRRRRHARAAHVGGVELAPAAGRFVVRPVLVGVEGITAGDAAVGVFVTTLRTAGEPEVVGRAAVGGGEQLRGAVVVEIAGVARPADGAAEGGVEIVDRGESPVLGDEAAILGGFDEVAGAVTLVEAVLLGEAVERVLHDPDVEVAVTIEVHERDAGDGVVLLAERELVRAEGEGAVTVVEEQLGRLQARVLGVGGEAGDDVEITVVVDVAEGPDLAGTALVGIGLLAVLPDCGLLRHVLELAVVRVAEEPGGAHAAGLEVVGNGTAAADDQIGPAIAVEVDGADAGALHAVEAPFRRAFLEGLDAVLPARIHRGGRWPAGPRRPRRCRRRRRCRWACCCRTQPPRG
ncbi:MAG: hypothetical protein QM820_15810 [Minicystis sp.]